MMIKNYDPFRVLHIKDRRTILFVLLAFSLGLICSCEDTPKAPSGSINTPKSGSIVTKTIRCTGTVVKAQAYPHYWLVVSQKQSDSSHLYWPKEPKINIQKDHSWSATIFEDGYGSTFSLELYAVKDSGQILIEDWIKTGARSGSFAPLSTIPFSKRLAIVEALKIE